MTEKIKWYREVLDLEPNSKIFFPLARLLAAEHDYSGAISTLEKGLARHEEYLEARLFLIELLHASGLKEECDQQVKRLAKMFTAYAGFWQAWAACLSTDKNEADTASILRFLAARFLVGHVSLHEVINRGVVALVNEVKPEALKSSYPSPQLQSSDMVNSESMESSDSENSSINNSKENVILEVAGQEPPLSEKDEEAKSPIEAHSTDELITSGNISASASENHSSQQETGEMESAQATLIEDEVNIQEAAFTPDKIGDEANSPFQVIEELHVEDSDLSSTSLTLPVVEEDVPVEHMENTGNMRENTISINAGSTKTADNESSAKTSEITEDSAAVIEKAAPELLENEHDTNKFEDISHTRQDFNTASDYTGITTYSLNTGELTENIAETGTGIHDEVSNVAIAAEESPADEVSSIHFMNVQEEIPEDAGEAAHGENSLVEENEPEPVEKGEEKRSRGIPIIVSEDNIPLMEDMALPEEDAPCAALPLVEQMAIPDSHDNLIEPNDSENMPLQAEPLSEIVNSTPEDEDDDKADSGDPENELVHPVSIKTRSMAEVLAEQGDIKGALEIYNNLLKMATNESEINDMERRMETLKEQLDSPQVPMKDASEVSKEKLIDMLEALAQRVEERIKNPLEMI